MAYPATFDQNGLTLATQAELVAYWTAQFQSIYGADVNLDSDSPDGQLLNILVQAMLDQQDVWARINASFDPDQATGVVQDQRYSINGIQRQAGTFSTINITLVNALPVNLIGQDALSANPQATVFTIADGAGTQWQLKTSINIGAPGTQTLVFQAVAPGKTLAQANTIQNIITVVVGVTSVNNPVAAAAPNLGQPEEADSLFKARRQRSVSIAAQGVHDALQAALENIPGVTYVRVYENNTGVSADINGNPLPSSNPASIPRNSIWVVIAGPTDPVTKAAIAQAIYTKRNTGCGMKGATQGTVSQLDGSNFYVYWDYVTPQRTFISFQAHSIDMVTPIDKAYIAAQLALNYVPAIGATLDGTSFGTAVQAIDPNCLVTDVLFSPDGFTFSDPLPPTAPNYQFTVAAGDIAILVI